MIKKTNSLKLLWIIIIAVTMGVYPFLPAEIPLKWNFAGVVTKIGHKGFIFVFPALAFIGVLMYEFFPKIDPKCSNYKNFSKPLSVTAFAFMLFIAVLEAVIIHCGFIPGSINIERVMPIIFGLLISCIGNIMPQIRNNYFFGIRTPWTLANEVVWRKTHRLTGIIWFFTGILFILTAFLGNPIKIPLFIIYTFVLVALPICYSYFIYRKSKKQEELT